MFEHLCDGSIDCSTVCTQCTPSLKAPLPILMTTMRAHARFAISYMHALQHASNLLLACKLTLAFFVQMELPTRLIHVNLMVCGMSGLGKTTCIANMLRPYLQRPIPHNGDRTSSALFEKMPGEMLFSTPPIKIPETREAVVYGIQDSPGYDLAAFSSCK